MESSSGLARKGSSSIWRNDGMDVFSQSSREEDDEEALKWAALERLPTLNRLKKGILKTSNGDVSEIEVHNLGLQERQALLQRLVKVAEEDNEKFLLKLKNRIDRVGIELPTIQVRYEHLKVEAEAYVGSRASPSFFNFCVNIVEGFLNYLRILPSRKKHLSILKDISGIIKPSRLTLLLGPPSSGKTTLLLALAGKLDPNVKVSGNVTYNGHSMNEFVPQRTAAYISQHDLHIGQMTVRETLAFSARCQGVGYRHEMLAELSRREKAANIKPDPDLDLFMKAEAAEGQEVSIVTDYVLKILGLEICADILVGNEMVRGISGGQRKRLTAGEMLVGPSRALFMDEISTGLDSSTTFQIVNSLKHFIHILNGTAVISLLQPAPETYELFDDIILLSDGQIVYQGPRENVLEFFEHMGFRCPDRKGVADFLQEVTSRKDQLRTIDMSENSLSGPIPEEFFKQCGSLRVISLAKNKFSGKIPESLSLCATLASINLSSNQFSGVLPAGIWGLNALRSLDLSDNLLEDEIPKGIEVLNNLRTINLSKNRFTGGVPDGIGSCLLLRSIDLSENSFSGNVPDTMQKLSLCSYLSLSKNLFAGEVPNWLGEMTRLESLDLSGNKFSGQVPDSIGNLQFLKVLNISANSLTGNLPETMANCGSLVAVDFSHNSMSGNIPAWIFGSGLEKVLQVETKLIGSFKSSSKLQVLDLSHNKFSGTIASSVGVLSSLQLLNLSGNSLAGPIPETIGGLRELESLDLSENNLNGTIPLGIGGAFKLKELRLERNLLSGKIPSSVENCSSLTNLILSRNNLTGPIPAALGKLTNLRNVDVSYNSLTGTLPKQLANLPNLYSFNIAHNHLQGELPAGGFFNTISPSSVNGNPSLCGAAVNKSCPAVLPKPIVLNPNSSSDSTPGSLPETIGHKRIILSISALIAIGAAAVIVIGVIAITVLNLRVRSSASRSAAALALSAGDEFSQSPTTDANSGKLVMFSGEPDFSTGTHALLNKDCELGRGGFGAVYRTVLRDGRPVAIKKLTVSSLVKSQEDFETEVKKLGKVRHQNLVTLEGYYWTTSLQLLIYEFISGGSLYKRLHEGSGGHFLSWNERFNVILGTAKGLAHLHQSNVIHYNIKSSNVLIDSSGEPKVGDYGLARLLPMLDRYVLSSKIQSALGYMAPEFACRTVKITEKCDVYGFGVLILEVVTGKRPVEYMEDDVVVLCDMVRGALEEGKVEECVDERLKGNFPVYEAVPVMKLGLICTSQVPSNRPDMGEVVNILELIRCPSEGQEDLG